MKLFSFKYLSIKNVCYAYQDIDRYFLFTHLASASQLDFEFSFQYYYCLLPPLNQLETDP